MNRGIYMRKTDREAQMESLSKNKKINTQILKTMM